MVCRIGICDDSKEVRQELEKILKQIEEKNSYNFEIIIFDSLNELNNFFHKNRTNLDILFLDIVFPEETTDGVYMGNQIRNYFNNDALQIIYISSHEKFMKVLFEVQPFALILKYEDFNFQKVEKIICKIIGLFTKQKAPFEYSIMGEQYTVDLFKILYFKIEGKKITIVRKDQKLKQFDEFNGKISEVAEKLADSDFFIPHKSYLVNYHNVKNFNYETLELINGEVLPVSQHYRKAVRKMRIMKMGGR